jgi:hypothetical protein
MAQAAVKHNGAIRQAGRRRNPRPVADLFLGCRRIERVERMATATCDALEGQVMPDLPQQLPGCREENRQTPCEFPTVAMREPE